MIDPKDADFYIDNGLCAICAWCEHWHNRKDNKQGTGSFSCDVLGCGGPLVGGNFIKYKGPLSSNLHSICFICGKEASSGIDIRGRVIGVCHNIHSTGRTCFQLFKEIISGNGNVVIKEEVVPLVGKQTG